MKRFVLTFVLLLVLCSVLASFPEINVAQAEPKTIVVPDDYPTIGAAIGNASEGDTIFVKKGTYYERLQVNKSLSLVGEDRETTIIDGGKFKNTVTITRDHVSVSGFMIQNSGEYTKDAGIYLLGADYCNISGNRVTTSSFGIQLTYSSNNIIIRNIIDKNRYAGIDLSGVPGGEGSNYNRIQGNEVVNNGCGIEISFGQNNTLYENNIAKNDRREINFYNSHNNSIAGNNVTNYSEKGITFTCSNNNTFYHNNFNSIQIVDYGWIVPPWIPNSSISVWDNGYPSGGNYWSDYGGGDADGDGIGDTPHVINENNQDNCPLMAPIYLFDAGTWEWTHYYVDVVSNSTASNFYFNPSEGPFLRFGVTGQDGTSGFCRVTIPKGLLWTQNVWTVKVNNQPVTPNIMEDSENTYLYFTYNHSTKTVEIQGTNAIAEFPTWTSTLLILIALAVAIAIYKRRLPKTPIH